MLSRIRLMLQDKVDLLKYNTNTNVNLYKLDNIYDYYFSNETYDDNNSTRTKAGRYEIVRTYTSSR